MDVTGSISISPATAASTTDESGPIGESVSETGLAVMVDAKYKLPINMGPIDLNLRFRAQEILATPGGYPEETSDFIGFGILMKYNF